MRRGTAATLEKNRCLKNAEYGILVYQEGEAALTGNECAENKRKRGFTSTRPPASSESKETCARATTQTGITVFDTCGGVIADNVCRSNLRYGIFVRKTAGMVTARSNKCMRNHDDGIAFAEETQSMVEDNTCSENGGSGIIFSGAPTSAEANTCEANRRPGIWVKDPTQP